MKGLKFFVVNEDRQLIAGFAKESDAKSWSTVHGNGRLTVTDDASSIKELEPAG